MCIQYLVKHMNDCFYETSVNLWLFIKFYKTIMNLCFLIHFDLNACFFKYVFISIYVRLQSTINEQMCGPVDKKSN